MGKRVGGKKTRAIDLVSISFRQTAKDISAINLLGFLFVIFVRTFIRGKRYTGICGYVSLTVAGIFTVMCYNVLCDKYATRQMYGYCPSWALDWEYRKKGILDEIRHYAADIISLQEVETDQFYNFFLPELKHDGYDGIFSPKSRAKTMAENDRKYVDGCAIFYRTAK